MQRIAELLDAVGRSMRRMWVRASSRQRMTAIVSALGLLAITGTLALMSLRPGAPTPLSSPLQGGTSTGVATLAPSATSTITPTPGRPIVKAPKPPPMPPTPTPRPSPTHTPVPTGAPSGTPTNTPLPSPTATPCGPGAYQGGNPTQSQLRTAMTSAANAYGLPANLVFSVAWEESRWHQDVVACDGGVGLMQIQGQATADWINQFNVPACSLGPTSYDMNNYDGNAHLGAKYLKWLSCFYSYWGSDGGTSTSNPGQYTIAWYYKNLGLQYPDTKNADGTTNPKSYCYAIYSTSAENPNLPSTTADPWSCPYNPQACTASQGCDPNRIHNPDNTLLDATISAYNQGAGGFDNNGLQNHTYVSNVESYIPQFNSGSLPIAS